MNFAATFDFAMSSLFQSTADILSLVPSIRRGETPTISRCISLIENEQPGYLDLLQSLPGDNHANKTIGITGPPGAGKSTMIDRMLSLMVDERNKKIAVLCVDPSSPFHHGALLGDRIRMSRWFNDGRVYIRSLASRGNVGGLSPTVIEITDLLKAADFDYIMIETVGVGQTEVEIAGIADATTVVLTPGSGDDI
ncbi:MAG TPA: GTP-binding protein, partial [Puia sp.]|nr:GTP-binding protein [Puia sp.]